MPRHRSPGPPAGLGRCRPGIGFVHPSEACISSNDTVGSIRSTVPSRVGCAPDGTPTSSNLRSAARAEADLTPRWLGGGDDRCHCSFLAAAYGRLGPLTGPEAGMGETPRRSLVRTGVRWSDRKREAPPTRRRPVTTRGSIPRTWARRVLLGKTPQGRIRLSPMVASVARG